MKKTLISLIAALALTACLALVAGCGGGSGSGGGSDNPTPSTDPTPTPSTDPTPTPSTDPEPATDPNAGDESLYDQFIAYPVSERAEILVKGTLDSYYFGTASEEYQVLYGVDEEQLANAYAMGQGQVATYVMEYFGVDGSKLSKETIAAFDEMVAKVLQQAKYKIGPTATTGAQWDVMVTVYPVSTLGMVGSMDLMDAWTAKEAKAKTDGAAAGEEVYAKEVIKLVEEVLVRGDNSDEGLVFFVPVKGKDDNKTLWISDTEPLDQIDSAVVMWQFPDAS